MPLLPAEFIKHSIDVYLNQHAGVSQKIYWIVLVFITAVLLLLPYVYVDVSVRDAGIIRPMAEKTEIKACMTELVDSVFVKEGQKVKQGDTILVFRHSNSEYKIRYQQKRLNDYRAHLNDLRSLANGSKPESFNSGTRKQEYAFFIRQKIERETNLSKASKDLERNQILFDKKIISEEEYDFFSYEYKKAVNELASLTDSQISKWQNELNVYTNALAEMETARMQEMKDKDLYAVLSPLTGTLDQFRGIYAGSNVQAGATLAILSPDSSLYAEIYASPRNIGYLHVGMQVKMQISAFNYNEWGSITGEVTDISSDFLTGKSETNYYYVVKCKMNSHCLTRKNGAKGILKKGMTVSSHFMITRRSLFDLLYQKMDDWINPAQLKI